MTGANLASCPGFDRPIGSRLRGTMRNRRTCILPVAPLALPGRHAEFPECLGAFDGPLTPARPETPC